MCEKRYARIEILKNMRAVEGQIVECPDIVQQIFAAMVEYLKGDETLFQAREPERVKLVQHSRALREGTPGPLISELYVKSVLLYLESENECTAHSDPRKQERDELLHGALKVQAESPDPSARLFAGVVAQYFNPELG